MAPELGRKQPNNQTNLPEVLGNWSEFEPQPRQSKVSGPVGWDQGPGSPLLGTDHLATPKPPSSLASHGSIVKDYGDTKHLEEDRKTTSSSSSNGPQASTDDLVAHLGAGFSDTLNRLKSRESNISIHDETTPPEDVSPGKLEDRSAKEEDLGLAIRASFQVSAEKEKKDFLPLDALKNILTANRVRRELKKLGVIPPEKLDQFTEDIWNVASPSPGTKTTRRKILAILALIKKVEKIVDFIQENLYDSDLPFALSNGTRPGLRQLDRRGKDGKLEAIKLFDTWEVHELELFEYNQWHLLAPYFHLSTRDDPKVRHYILDKRIILPFTEDNEVKHEGGGYSDVWKVVIHPAHHNYCNDSASHGENPPYAVKRLRHDNYEAFNTEVSNLKLFSAKDHLHLIKLLVTFYWHGQYYLLFPWADGNLLDFWKQYPNPLQPKRDHQLALWLSKQCLGIAEGLKMIHTADKPAMRDPTHDDSTHQLHGRHGDLKPENILWFKPYLEEFKEADQGCAMGLLKISDFGLTRFHGTMSRSHINASGVPVSPTYRAPEYDIAKMVSQSYDIWTLGCVILEFVTWYLLGWEEVDRFAKNRAREDNAGFKEHQEDVFFNFVNIKNENGTAQTGAIAKQSVADEFRSLCSHKNCSDFLSDLLDFIETSMLRMGPKKRASCEEIVKKFTELHNLCLEDLDYCTKRVKVPPNRAATNLSLLKASAIDFSPEMEKRVNRTVFPEHTGPLENDPEPVDTDQSTSNSNENVLPASARRDTITEAEASMPTAVGKRLNEKLTSTAPLASSDTESQNSRPQSPNRKVHFPQNLQSLSHGSFKAQAESTPMAPQGYRSNQTNPSQLSPTSLQALVQYSTSDSAPVLSGPESDHDSTNAPAESSESSIVQSPPEQAIGEQTSPTELTSVPNGLSHSKQRSEQKDISREKIQEQNPSLAGGSANAAVPTGENNIAARLKRFFHKLCCGLAGG